MSRQLAESPMHISRKSSLCMNALCGYAQLAEAGGAVG